MDRKQITIVSIIAVIMVVLVFVVVGMDQSSSKGRLTNDELIRIGNNTYTIEDLSDFMYISNEAAGDIEKELNEENINELYTRFNTSMVYANAADSKMILYPSGDAQKAEEEYATKSEVLSKYNVTLEDYLKYKEAEYKSETILRDVATYYTIPEDDYNNVMSQYSGDDLKTYTFRTMNFHYEEPELDESGEVIPPEPNESGELPEDKSEETIRAKAELALASVRSGEDFETYAKENADGRYTITPEYSFVYLNGDVETAIGPFLNSKLSSSDELEEKVKALNVGEVTDIVKVDTSFIIAKLENVEEGFVGDAKKEFDSVLYRELADGLIRNTINVKENESALVRFLYMK